MIKVANPGRLVSDAPPVIIPPDATEAEREKLRFPVVPPPARTGTRALEAWWEERYNPNHDELGRFTSGDSDGGGGGWSPTMSRADAEAWSANSALPGAYYHGTAAASVPSIEAEGLHLDASGAPAGHGPYAEGEAPRMRVGVYATDTRLYAQMYAAEDRVGGGAVLETRINVSNPSSDSETMALMREAAYQSGVGPGTADYREMVLRLAAEKGYDALTTSAPGKVVEGKIKLGQTAVVLDPHDITVVNDNHD